MRAGQDRQHDAGDDEAGRENPRGPGQNVCRRASAHEPATATTAATTHTERAAFGALQQNYGDQRDGDNQMNDEDNSFHGAILFSGPDDGACSSGLRGLWPVQISKHWLFAVAR